MDRGDPDYHWLNDDRVFYRVFGILFAVGLIINVLATIFG